MLSEAQLIAISNRLQAFPELHGCVVGHYGATRSRVLFPGIQGSSNYNIAVIIDEMNIRPQLSYTQTSPPPPPTVAQVTNDSRVGRELIGAGLSCGFTAIAGVGFVASLAAEGVSLGTSTFLAVAAWGGMVSGGLQCMNGLYRSYEVIANPHSDSLEQLDNEVWYSRTCFVVDAVGVLSAVVGIGAARRALLELLERRAALPSAAALERMTRPERDVAMREALRRASQTPAARRELQQALQEAFPDRNIAAMMRAGGSSGTLTTGRVVSGIISQQLATSIGNEIRGIILSVAGIGVSATPASWTGSGSGSVNTIATTVINIIEIAPSN